MSHSTEKGGRFLFAPTDREAIFTCEDFGEESLQFARTAEEFATKEVVTRRAAVEGEETKIQTHTQLLKQAGELGLLMVEVPEALGGLGLKLSDAMLVAERCAKLASFNTSIMCHTGIGTVPIIFYGTPAQKDRYVPKLASGEWLGAYALTEEGFGSDALGAKTRATKSADGEHWILNGVKQFITNAGFADVFTVYAKVDGEHFTAFIVEADTPGVSTGPEEHKMGIKGSSTRQLILEDVKIPIGNLLGEVGQGHKVALNVLNIGRLKLGVGCLGGCKEILRQSLEYAANRRQFGKSIDQFQMIQRKLADMALEIYATESMAYRCSGAIDHAVEGIELDPADPGYMPRKIECIEEFLIEASILKIYGSEALDTVVDHAVQIHGGYGYIEEYPVCGAYRDSRINRLFEGTSEINRMLIPGTVLKRAMKGQMDMMTAVTTLMAEIKAGGINTEPRDGVLGREAAAIDIVRRWATFGYGVAAQRAMQDPKFLQGNQILLEQLADLTMDIYAAESCFLRADKAVSRIGEHKNRIAILLTEVIVYEKLRHAMETVRQICANVAADDSEEFSKNAKAMHRMTYSYGLDTLGRKARLASNLVERGRYDLQ